MGYHSSVFFPKVTVEKFAEMTYTNNSELEELEKEISASSKAILFLFFCFAVGAFARQLMKKFHLPYTVVIFLVGMVFGFFTHRFAELRPYTSMTRIDAAVMMQIFLPTLIFESAYSMDAHMFLRSLGQCLLLALPGLVISTLLIASYSMTALSGFGWDWVTALLFGSILSATDPVAVVALFKECGISPKLTTLIEGESLVNDGSAIVAFDVLLDILIAQSHGREGTTAVGIFWIFLKIAVAAPVFGYFMGKLATLCLMQVFKDAVLEFTITLCFAYLTYFISEVVMGISGVLAVVVLGVKISFQKSSFSPETEHSVHCFWEMMSYFANTLIFLFVGIIIAEKTARFITPTDAALAFCTYLFITVARLVMVLLLSPFLKHTGYGLPWKNCIAVVWGGLRGAVGMALAIMLVECPAIDDATVANKIIIQLSICIVLTLVINGTTMEYLLDALGLKRVSHSHRIAMSSVISRLRDTATKSRKVHMKDKYLSGANWLWVESHTEIADPYKTVDIDALNVYTPIREIHCGRCDETVYVEPTKEEKEEMEEEARIRALTALTTLIWNSFERSYISRSTVSVLMNAVSEALDKPEAFIDGSEIHQKNMRIPKFYLCIRDFFMRLGEKIKAEEIVKLPIHLEEMSHRLTGFRWKCLKVYIYPFFEPFIFIVLILNVIPIVMDIWFKGENIPKIMTGVNSVFLLIYFLEAYIKMIALGYRVYFSCHWNKFAFIVLVIGLIDLAVEISLIYVHWTSPRTIALFRIVRLFRILEAYKMLKILMALAVIKMKNTSSAKLYNAFDLGFGLLLAQAELLQKIDFEKHYHPCGMKPVIRGEECMLDMIKALNKIHDISPGVAIALKSHKAALNIFNDVFAVLLEILESGMIDDAEYEKLSWNIEESMQAIARAPKVLPASDDLVVILKKIDWIQDQKLIDAIMSTYVVRDYKAFQTLSNIGDTPTSIDIIVSGVVKISGHISKKKTDCLPNTDSTSYFSSSEVFYDYTNSLYCLGVLGFLENSDLVTSSRCETDVRLIHISYEKLRIVDKVMKPPLSYLLWRDVALKIAVTILHEQPRFHVLKLKMLKIKLESAILPDLSECIKFNFEEGVNAAVLIQGKATDPVAGALFIGPQYIPSATKNLQFDEATKERPRIVLLLLPEDTYTLPAEFDWSGQDSVPKPTTLCLQHAAQQRLASAGALVEDMEKSPTAGLSRFRKLSRFQKKTSSTLPLTQ